MKLEKIYTGGGDSGITHMPTEETCIKKLRFTGRVSKDHILIETNQYINILNVKLGYLYGSEFDDWIRKIQKHLTKIMGEIVSASSEISLKAYCEEFGMLYKSDIEQIKEFQKVVESKDIHIMGWVKYDQIKSLPFFEACEACRLAEIYIVKCHSKGMYISSHILEYFNYLSKMLFMMGYIVYVDWLDKS